MAYQFQATFTQPLLTELDAGKVKDARTWANAITNYYITTIKQGLPSGVPTTLPAPGLNPTGPPPPFTIGASPFLTADTRRQMFYNTVYAYFYAKELKLQRASVDETISSIKQLVRRAKVSINQIKALKTQIELVNNQLKQLPNLIEEVDNGIKELIAEQVRDVKTLMESIRSSEFGLTGQVEFDQLFASEIAVAQSLTSFSISNRAEITKLARYVAEQSNAADRFLLSPRREDLIKAQLNRRLTKFAKQLLTYVEIPIKPNLFIDFANKLERRSNRFARFARAIRQIGFLNRFIQPKLARLKARLRSIVNELRNKIQPKIVQTQNKLAKDKQDYAARRQEGKSGGLFKKAGKVLRQARTQNNELIKRERLRVQAGHRLIKRTVSVSTKLVGLITSVEQEIGQLEVDLLTQKKRLAEVGDGVQALSEGEYDQNTEINHLRAYFDDAGLAAFAQAAVGVMVNTQSSARDVINLVERRTSRYKRYGEEIETLGDEVRSIQQDISVVFASSKGGKSKSPKSKNWVGERIASIKSILDRIVKWLKPKVDKILDWLRTKTKQLANYITTKLKKYGEALQVFALNLIPFSSTAKDGQTKKQVADAKRRLLKDKATRARSIARKIRILAPAAPATALLVNNLRKGKFRLSDNQTSATRITNAIFAYRLMDKLPDQQRAIMKEKASFFSNFNTLLVVESILSSLSLVSTTIKQEAKQEFDQAISDAKHIVSGVKPNELQTLDNLAKLAQEPPTTLQQIKSAGNMLAMGAVSDIAVTNRLVDFEKRHLRRVKQVLTSILDQQGLKKKYQQMLEDGQTCGVFYTAYTELKKVVAVLNKQQSFILMLLKALGKVVDMLFKWITKNVNQAISSIKKSLEKDSNKVENQTKEELKKRLDRRYNPDALGMSIAFGLAARSFWTGASWTGPTGTGHTCLSIGRFKKMKARTEDGASGFIRELANGFENQLKQMQGIAAPPSITGIAPIKFVGYN